jgi:hypothetical protein
MVAVSPAINDCNKPDAFRHQVVLAFNSSLKTEADCLFQEADSLALAADLLMRRAVIAMRFGGIFQDPKIDHDLSDARELLKISHDVLGAVEHLNPSHNGVRALSKAIVARDEQGYDLMWIHQKYTEERSREGWMRNILDNQYVLPGVRQENAQGSCSWITRRLRDTMTDLVKLSHVTVDAARVHILERARDVGQHYPEFQSKLQTHNDQMVRNVEGIVARANLWRQLAFAFHGEYKIVPEMVQFTAPEVAVA